MYLPDLADDLARLLQRVEHLRRLLPPLPDVLRLGEQAGDLLLLVEAGHQLGLEVVLDLGTESWIVFLTM